METSQHGDIETDSSNLLKFSARSLSSTGLVMGSMAAPIEPDGMGLFKSNERLLSKPQSVRDLSPKAQIRKTAKELGYDIVSYATNVKTKKLKAAGQASSSYAKTLRRTVDELSLKHEILFKGMVKKLQISKDNAHATIDNIANEMLSDHQFNWGRLVTLYAFTASLAKHCAENNEIDLVEEIADYTGNYVTENLTDIIHQNGGWKSFEAFFPEPQSVENTIWKGLICTALGLGAIATMVSVR